MSLFGLFRIPYISKNHAVIGIEDLTVSEMLANGKLSKAISDMGFYEFRRQLVPLRGSQKSKVKSQKSY
ncbi:transposase, IS607 family protein [Sphaerospermopsis reniformis]|uniref:Transposase, IS607 family protein n=1 Tax=Sphaerospermopsis reniformis TaxID=531300 RepID=A0A479ZYJ6_9CYAN|nr:transposase, IS607 family protein [Sphaerospermopsis reniformis]